MKIAVIGDYESTEYGDLLALTRLYYPDETILDLSRHHLESWTEDRNARAMDIETADLVLLSRNFRENHDCMIDLTNAHKYHKEILIENQGGFMPVKN